MTVHRLHNLASVIFYMSEWSRWDMDYGPLLTSESMISSAELRPSNAEEIPLVKDWIVETVQGIRRGSDEYGSWKFVPRSTTVSVCTRWPFERCPLSHTSCFRILSVVEGGLDCRGHRWCDIDGDVDGRSVWEHILQNAYDVAHNSYDV